MPHLVRAEHVAPAPAATVTASAVAHLGRLSAAWGVRGNALPTLAGAGEVTVPGGTIARVRQTIDGMPVDRSELRVMIRGNGELVAANGVLVGTDTPRTAIAFKGDDTNAVAIAVRHNYKRSFVPTALAQKHRRDDGSRTIGGRSGGIDVQLARASKVWHYTGSALVPAWVVEAYASEATSTNGDAFRTVIAADGGRIIAHHSLVADVAFNYRVFAEANGEFHPFDGPIVDSTPHPTGLPNGLFPAYVPPTLVSVDGLNHPAGSTVPDPWLASTRTETQGNNVEAYTDINAPSGLTFGDFRATTTAARTFDRTYDTIVGPLTSQNQNMASITSLFYGINWLHDFWYDAGFTEAAGNAQDNNYGRGGEDRDAILAEAQDNANGGSRNNANMSTPADGLPPRMQVFLWSGKDDRKLTLLPTNRVVGVGSASFGLQNFDATGALVLGVDATAPANDACTALTNSVAGRVVLVDRGSCSFKLKTLNVQNAGGLGVIIANNVAGTSPPALGDDATITTPITIGALSITQAEGVAIKAEITAGAVTGIAHRLVGPELDGGLDSTLVAHEFGHYVHHRLQDCTSTWCRAMSEGWGDVLALILMARAGDNLNGAYPFSVYTTQSFTNDAAYFGIRRAPYSTNTAINALSYRHMADGEAPPTHPFIVLGNNAEVHNAGEVWAATVWEVYVALQQAGTSFDAVRAKMSQYIVAALLMAPKDSTPTEFRDAMLAVAVEADRPVMMAAFARRGMGSCAVTPARDSVNFVGIVEGNTVSGRGVTGAPVLEVVDSCDDDDVLDNGETASITLPITNNGHAALTNVRITVTAPTTPGITVVTPAATIASFPQGMTQDLRVDVKLDDSAAGPLAGDFVVKIEAENGCESVLEIPFSVRLNVDEAPATSATDTFDATSIWTATSAATTTPSAWAQARESGLDGIWRGTDVASVSDTSVESPAVTVGTTAPFVITFNHRYSFEYSEETAWDGGVIELSTDGGANWVDVSTLGVVPGYNQEIEVTANNPLGGRLGYANTNPSYPSTDPVTLDFGTQLAGMSVKLRFRIGTDVVVGAPGWEIDDVAFGGITGTPFPTQVADTGTCGAGPGPDGGSGGNPLPPDEMPGCCDAGPIRGSNLVLMMGVLVFLLRRRRRS